jgi:hypothetical protein
MHHMLHYTYIAYHVSNMIIEVCNIIFIVVTTALFNVSDVFWTIITDFQWFHKWINYLL